MLIVVSPAKKLDYESTVPVNEHSMPEMLDQSQELVEILKAYCFPARLAMYAGFIRNQTGPLCMVN